MFWKFWFFFTHLTCIPEIPLTWSLISLKSWTSTGCPSNSTGSCSVFRLISRRFNFAKKWVWETFVCWVYKCILCADTTKNARRESGEEQKTSRACWKDCWAEELLIEPACTCMGASQREWHRPNSWYVIYLSCAFSKLLEMNLLRWKLYWGFSLKFSTHRKLSPHLSMWFDVL